MPVYESLSISFQDATPRTRICRAQVWAGHAVVVVGFDDDRFGGAFRVLNSWGPGWGDQGFFWLPYDTFREARFDAFALTIEDRVNGDVAPPPEPAPRTCCVRGG